MAAPHFRRLLHRLPSLGAHRNHGPRPALLLLAAIVIGLVVALIGGARPGHAAEQTPHNQLPMNQPHMNPTTSRPVSSAIGSATTEDIR